MNPGRLYIVATPIGNLEDITPRALRILSEVDLIAAEDTRHSKFLIDHFNIKTPLTSYHDHNEEQKAVELIALLESGRDVALITDAGTPTVSDPGYRLVRAAHQEGIPVYSVPGPSAVVAALAVSGLPNDSFSFHGFFPKKSAETRRLLQRIRQFGGTHIFFESPHRIKAALKRIAETLPDAQVCVAREMTKLHEEVVMASATDVAERFEEGDVKGECVILLHTIPEIPGHTMGSDELRKRVKDEMRRSDLSTRDAVRKVAEELNVPRKKVYSAAIEEK